MIEEDEASGTTISAPVHPTAHNDIEKSMIETFHQFIIEKTSSERNNERQSLFCIFILIISKIFRMRIIKHVYRCK